MGGVDGQPQAEPTHQGPVFAVAFSPDGKTVLTGSGWRNGAALECAPTANSGGNLPHQGPVTAVAFSPDGKTVLTGSDDHTARLWDVSTGSPGRPALRT